MTIGFDLGKYSTKISSLSNGKIEIILNNSSGRNFKSMISFKDKRYWGDEAYQYQINNYKNTINCFLQILDKENINKKMYIFPNLEEQEKNTNIEFKINYINNSYLINAECILIMYFKYFKQYFEKKSICHDYLTLAVPLNYSLEKKKIITNCLNGAGFKNCNIINSGLALNLEYGFYRSGNKTLNDINDRNVIFIDFGEYSTEVYLSKFQIWKFTLIDSFSSDFISGFHLKQLIYNECKCQYKKKFSKDLQDKSKSSVKIYKEIDKILKNLSINKKTNFLIENILDDMDITFSITRELLDNYLDKELLSIQDRIKKLIKINSIKYENIHSIEILGGISRVYFINNWLKNTFSNKLSFTMDREESITKGCSLYSAILSPKVQMKKLEIMQNLNYPIILKSNNKESILFQKGSTIPKSKKISIKSKKFGFNHY